MAGSIINRGENTWLVRVYLGRRNDGKRLNHNKTIHGTKKDAQKYLNQVLRERDLGQLAEPAKQKTLDQYLDQWLESRKDSKPQTVEHYRIMLELYVRQDLGGLRLDRLQRAHLVELYHKHEKATELGPATMQNLHRVIRAALNQAVEWGYLPKNPAQGLKTPRKVRRKPGVLTQAQVDQLLAAAAADPFWWFFWVWMLATGMRPGEIMALQWTAIDWEGRTVMVTDNVAIRRRDGKVWQEVGEVKTGAGRRRIQLGPELVRELRTHRARLAELRLQVGSGWKDNGLIFPSPLTGGLCWHNMPGRHFKVHLERAGLPLRRLYDLRHTNATLLLLRGYNPKVVAERLGHSSVAITLDIYSEVLPTLQQEVAETLDNVLSLGNRTPKLALLSQ